MYHPVALSIFMGAIVKILNGTFGRVWVFSDPIAGIALALAEHNYYEYITYLKDAERPCHGHFFSLKNGAIYAERACSGHIFLQKWRI